MVQDVVAGSSADAAGVKSGDVLMKVGDVEARTDEDWGAKFRRRYRGQAGAPITITVQRDQATVTLNTQVRERGATTFEVTLAPTPTPKQAKIWRGVSSGSTGS